MNKGRSAVLMSFLIVTGCAVYGAGPPNPGNSAANIEKHWTEQDVKEHLKLPYDKSIGSLPSASFKRLESISGIFNIALVSAIKKGQSVYNKERILHSASFEVVAPDLSSYEVSLSEHGSSKEVCETILNTHLPKVSDRSMIFYICIPNHTDSHYALTVKGSFTKRLYLVYEKGLLIKIVAKDDCYKYPCNLDVQVAQMDMIKESLISLIDGKYQPADRDKAYHNLLIEKHWAIKRPQGISSIPDGVVNLDLTILKTSCEPELVQLEKMESVIDGQQYILGLKRGERIAVTKIANPKNVTTIVPDVPSVKVSLDTFVNVMVVCTCARVNLRPDELYEITFRGLGESKVELFYLNQIGDVTHYGKLIIAVHPAKEKYKDPRKQRLYENGFEPGSYGYRPQYSTLEEAKAAIGFDDKKGAIKYTKDQFETIVLEMPGLRATLRGYDKRTKKYLVRIDLE